MTTLAGAAQTAESRETPRVPFAGAFDYEYEGGEAGTGLWRSMSPDGACVQVGRYMRPGRVLRVRYYGCELVLRVVWCRQADASVRFVAGVQLVEGGPELALMTLMALVRRGRTRVR